MKKFLKITAVIAATLLFLSCSSKKEDKAEIKYHLNVGRLGSLTMSPTVTIANHKGYFKKYGLEVNLQNLGDNVAEPLTLGKIDATFQSFTKELVLAANGQEITFFGGTQSGGVYVGVHKDNYELLKDPANWRGKAVGAKLLATSDITMKYYVYDKLGYEIGKDIIFKPVEDKPSIAMSIGKKTIDLGLVDPEFVSILEANGGRVLANVTDFVPDNVCCRQVAYTPNLKANREAYVAFLKAQILAYKEFKLDVDNSIKTLAKAYGQDEDYVITMIYDTKQNANRGYNPDPNYNGVLGVFSTLKDLGYLESSNLRQLHEFFDISIYADALHAIIAEYPGDTFFTELWEYFVSHNNEYPNFEKDFL